MLQSTLTKKTGDKIDSGLNVFLNLIVPFYSYYWYYKISKCVDGYAKNNNIPSETSKCSFLSAVFIEPFAAILIQHKINEIVYKAYINKNVSENDRGCYANYYFGEENYLSLTKHILLSLFTFGVWNIIWIYRTTKILNMVQGTRYRSPVKKALLYLFTPFYYVQWAHKSAQRTEKLAGYLSIESDIAITSLLSSIFMPWVPVSSCVIQNIINQAVLVTKENESIPVVLPSTKTIKNISNAKSLSKEFYSILPIQLLLCFVTLGFWNFVWIYRITKLIRKIDNGYHRPRPPIAEVLFNAFLPILYHIFWSWKIARIVDKLAKEHDVDTGVSVPAIFAAWTIPLTNNILSPIVLQAKLNEIVVLTNGKVMDN